MKLTTREKASYGMGAVGKDLVYILVASFFMYYCTEVLKISGTFVGVLFMVARVFDALNDPFMGVVVEKTNSRFGKFRPWLLIGTILNAVILVVMFSVPSHLEGVGLLAYVSVAYIAWGVTYTIMDIPYWSMIPAITEAGTDRENISVIARSCAGVGAAIATALTLKAVSLLGGKNELLGFKYFSIAVAIFFIAAIVICVTNVKEHRVEKKKVVTVKEMFTSLIRNDQALVIVISIIMFNASLYITQQLAIYFFKYDIGNKALYSVFGVVGGATQIIAMMFLPALRKKFESKNILVGAIGVTLVGYTSLFILGTINCKNMVLLCIAAMIIFFGFGLATVLTTIFLADTVDYGEWKDGQRNDSVIFSLQTFVVKLASAVSVLIAGVGIDVIGLNEDVIEQSAQTIFGLRFIMCIIPMIGLVVSIMYFIKKYKLDQNKLEVITKDLAERRAANDSE
ncbi:MAG: glycoside-pentoside-hexuronide (GPH):cation symporter [bacterium]|nr:glycoside-pentoside-hexuronide (GPH):cation symporter [bacterium]